MPKQLLAYIRPIFLVIAVSLLVFLLSRIGVEKFTKILKSLSFSWIGCAALCILANFGCAAYRFKVIVSSQLKYMAILEVVMASYLLNYASMVQGLGIGAKIGLMKSKGVEIKRSLAGIWVEILFDLFCTFPVALIYFLYYGVLPRFSASSKEIVLFFVLLLILLFFGVFVIPRYSVFLKNIRNEFVKIIKAGKIFLIITLTACIWGTAGFGFFCMVMANDSGFVVSPFLTIAAVCTGFITGLVSMVPGGIGIREVTWAYVVSQGGVSVEVVGLLAILYRLLSIALIIAIFLAWNVFHRTQHQNETNGVD
jgi:uncharacterized membrane protein YbhN (UPF0104 family)